MGVARTGEGPLKHEIRLRLDCVTWNYRRVDEYAGYDIKIKHWLWRQATKGRGDDEKNWIESAFRPPQAAMASVQSYCNNVKTYLKNTENWTTFALLESQIGFFWIPVLDFASSCVLFVFCFFLFLVLWECVCDK